MRRSFLALMLGSAIVGIAPVAQAQEAPAAAPDSTYFVLRLIPPRATFMQDMKPNEAQAMGEHVAYWTAAAKQGRTVIFGPVVAPSGVWGLGVLRAKDEAEVKAFTAQDPAVLRGIGMKYEIAPMMSPVVGKVE